MREAQLKRLDEGQDIAYELKEENGKICATNLTLK
jgi:cold shock CspA family protein